MRAVRCFETHCIYLGETDTKFTIDTFLEAPRSSSRLNTEARARALGSETIK